MAADGASIGADRHLRVRVLGGFAVEGWEERDLGTLLDATVPNWRLSVQGGDALRVQLGQWYANPGQFLSLKRTPLPEGELVEFTLTWSKSGIEYTCHQAHILEVVKDRVGADTAFCGGRWPAPLVAEMNGARAGA